MFCSICLIYCRMSIKTKTCENKRDVIVLFDCDYEKNHVLPSGTLFHSKNDFQEKHHIKAALKYENEACLNVSLVKVLSNRVVYVDDWKSVDAFFNNAFFGTKTTTNLRGYSYNSNLKDYLQLFSDITIQRSKKRTLVIYSKSLAQEMVDFLYKLQVENHVDVILVSTYRDNFNYKQFPRHLKFFVLFGRYSDLVSKQIVDVIKNPEFNIYEFNKNLASFEDRSCLENLIFIPVVSWLQFTDEITHISFIAETIFPIRERSYEVLDIQPLLDYKTNKIPYTTTKYFKVFYRHNTSIDELTQAGIFEGRNRNIFILFHQLPLDRNVESVVNHVKNLLKNENQTIVELFVINRENRYYFYADNFWYAFESAKGVEIILNYLVYVGCK